MKFSKYGIYTPQDLMDYLQSNMSYGFTYRGKVFTVEEDPEFQADMDRLYKIRLGEDFIKNKYGVCWDFCELEREFFIQAKIEHECFFIESFKNKGEDGPTHTFALFKKEDKWCWFEYSWGMYQGVWCYNTKEEALKDIMKKHYDFYNGQFNNLEIYKTKKVTKRLDTIEFVEHCIKSRPLKIKFLD